MILVGFLEAPPTTWIHWGLAEGLLETCPAGDRTTDPSIWAVINDRPHQGPTCRHLWSTDQFKHEYCIEMRTIYPRKSAVFADISRALCRCTLLFWSLFQFPLGKQSFQYMSGETRTYTLSHQGRTSDVNLLLKWGSSEPRRALIQTRIESIPKSSVG